MILNREGTPANLQGLPDYWMPQPIGDAASVRKAISAAVPGVDWSDPAWGTYRGDGFSVEFNFQADGTVEGFALHIRGGGDPFPTIVALCARNDWAAVDYSTGELIDLEHPSRDSWAAFQQYRDKVAGTGAD